MAKGRMLQNRISKSNKLASLSSDTVRLLYTWMLSHLDVNGNFYADPVMVNNLVFTRLGHSVDKVSKALDELEQVGLIIRYEVDGEQYLNYPDFFEKQPKINPDREGTPEIPCVTQEQLKSKSGVAQPQIKLNKDKISKDKRREGVVFTPPTLQQISEYCLERKNKINPEHFLNHYQSNGWLVGKNKMKDWKAAIRTWEVRDNANTSSQGCSTNPYRRNNHDRPSSLTADDNAELDKLAADYYKNKAAVHNAG
jgi:hypothetical protein